jgi:hypothetical protein
LFKVTEKKKGDVYFAIRTGRAFGDTPDQVLAETRISLHPSLETDASLIRFQMKVADQSNIVEGRAFTYAPRNDHGDRFFPVAFTRHTKLAGEHYDIEARSARQSTLDVSFGAINPTAASIAVGVFVGAPTSTFPLARGAVLEARYFKIVVLARLNTTLPSDDLGHTHIVCTVNPVELEGKYRCNMVAFMKGLAPDDCDTFMDFRANELNRALLERRYAIDVANGYRFSEAEERGFVEAKANLKQKSDAYIASLPPEIAAQFPD